MESAEVGQKDGDDEEIPDLEKSMPMRQFNKAFKFVEEMGKQSSREDDLVDANLRHTLV